MTTTPPQKLWVLLKSNDPAVVNYTTQVPTKDCDNVDDFIKAIKKELQLPQPPQSITLHLTKDVPPLERDDILPNQNTKQTALVVTVPSPATPSSATPLLKSHRQQSFRKMAVAASCCSFLDAVATKLKILYGFDCMHRGRVTTIGDVLRAKGGVEGVDWSFQLVLKTHDTYDDDGFYTTVKKGTPLTAVRLPDFFTDDEWTKLSGFNKMTNHLIHGGVLPTLRTGTPYIILRHDDYNNDMIDFLKTIGVKVSLFPNKSWLEVKDEDALSEGSSLI